MDAVAADDLPLGVVRVDHDGTVVDANAYFCEWIENTSPIGRPLRDFLVPVEDFLNVGRELDMSARPDRPDRAAFVIEAADGATLLIVDASARYAAGRVLRDAHSLANRTRTRLQLVIDASIAFAQATTEERLAEILAATTAQAYQAEESAVYLTDEHRRLSLAFGTNPFADLAPEGEESFDVLGLRDVLKISGDEDAALISEKLPAAMAATGVRAIIAAPLHTDGESFGIFACFHHPRRFDDEAAPLADALAGQAAQALATIRLQRQLEHAAMHDDTTGLPNRRRLEEQASGFTEDQNLAVMFVDLDGFKDVNDQLGHPQGDAVLYEVAGRLRSTVREDDLVARWGGDEFVVICDLQDGRGVAELAERVRESLGAPYPSLPAPMPLGASIGVAVGSVRRGTLSIEPLIRRADQAMYAAKLAGGNQVAGI